MQTPLREPSRTPKHMTAGTYNRIPVLPIYKTYPVYAPGREPAGYMERLRELEPEIVFDPDRLHTPDEWAKACMRRFSMLPPSSRIQPRPRQVHSSFQPPEFRWPRTAPPL